MDMWQSVLRILLVSALVYGAYRVMPVVKPVIQETANNSDATKGLILGDTANYLERVFTGSNDSTTPKGEEQIQKAVNEMVEKTKENLSSTVQTDLNKAKDSVKEATNEQFCRAILKTVQEQCGKYYCE